MSACINLYALVKCRGGQRKVLDPLELESDVAVYTPPDVNSRSYGRTGSALNHRAIYPVHKLSPVWPRYGLDLSNLVTAHYFS